MIIRRSRPQYKTSEGCHIRQNQKHTSTKSARSKPSTGTVFPSAVLCSCAQCTLHTCTMHTLHSSHTQITTHYSHLSQNGKWTVEFVDLVIGCGWLIIVSLFIIGIGYGPCFTISATMVAGCCPWVTLQYV
jgi:hypothetical protein